MSREQAEIIPEISASKIPYCHSKDAEFRNAKHLICQSKCLISRRCGFSQDYVLMKS
jgi:hypothetical protein